MVLIFYNILLLTLPFSVCYNYDFDQEESYQPKVHKKVRGRLKYHNYEENPKVDRDGFEAYSDDMEPMAQLDLTSFLQKPSEDFLANNMPGPSNVANTFYKHKRGIPKKSSAKRKHFNENLLSEDLLQMVSMDKLNTKNQLKKRISKNNHGLARNTERNYLNAETDLTNEEANLNSNTNIDHIRFEENDHFSKQSKRGKVRNSDISADFSYRDSKRKSEKVKHNKHYNFNKPLFHGNTKQKSTLRTSMDYGSDARYKDGNDSPNVHDKIANHEHKKVVKRFKFPFFSHDKSDTKRHKKRKLFCGSISKKVSVLTTSTLPRTPVTAKVLKRSYEEIVCPMCQAKFVYRIEGTDKRSPTVHNSRQYFNFLSQKKALTQKSNPKAPGHEEDLEDNETVDKNTYPKATETKNQKDRDDRGNEELEIKQNEFQRWKRQQLSYEKSRQLKELDEVQRKVDSVEIKGLMIKRPEYT